MPISTYGTILRHVPTQARQSGFCLDNVDAMRRARVLVVQGGFSSVSEAMALRRPTVVVPIGRHAEQHVNAQMLEASGIGVSAEAPDAAAKIEMVWNNHGRFAAVAGSRPALPSDGAFRAAAALLEMLSMRNMP